MKDSFFKSMKRKETEMGRLKNIWNRSLDEVGYKEKKNNAMLDDKTANAGDKNYTKYARDYSGWVGVNFQAQAWCAMFLSWLFVQEYGLDGAKKVLCGNLWASCTACRDAFHVKGRFSTRDPQAGDLVIFKDSKGGPAHIGLVTKVDNNIIHTIEGNTSPQVGVVDNGGEVCEKAYGITYTMILGFCRPDYEMFPLEVEKPKTVWNKGIPLPDNAGKQSGEWVRCSDGVRSSYKLNEQGDYPVGCWLQDKDGRWYLFDREGYMLTGWREVSGKWYYLDTEKGAMFSSTFVADQGKLYYLTSDGSMAAGKPITLNVAADGGITYRGMA